MELVSRIFNLIKVHINFSALERESEMEDFSYTEEEKRQNPKTETDGNDEKLRQYYANLEIPYGSDILTVKKAWKKMMKQYHPDLHAKDPEKQQNATILTQELTHAYNGIKNAFKLKNSP
jgi:DnaJ-domain-containing protein 1